MIVYNLIDNNHNARRSSIVQTNLVHVRRNASIKSKAPNNVSIENINPNDVSQYNKDAEEFYNNIDQTIHQHDIKEASLEEIKEEMKITKALNEQIVKKVIIVIMVVMITSVIFDLSTFDDGSTDPYIFVANLIDSELYNYTKNEHKFTNYVFNNFDEDFPIINITLNNKIYYENISYVNKSLRKENVLLSFSAAGNAIVYYDSEWVNFRQSLLNILRTIYISFILLIFSLLFENDTNEKILEPLDMMMEIVHTVSQNPIRARNIEDLNDGTKALIFNYEQKEQEKDDKRKAIHMSNYEIMVIKSALIKISALLAIGFGEAGGEIIQENLNSNEFNPMIKGSKKVAIFGFCDIRGFAEINHILEEQTLVFVNEIAEIVHSCADTFGGAVNKNLGDAFILFWKLDDKDWIIQNKEVMINNESPHTQFQADQALLSYMAIIIKINTRRSLLRFKKDKQLLSHFPNFKVNMGFGLHVGWAIEGAIGSNHKIDASYLSPNMNMSARLEAASRQYNVHILMSGNFYDLLSFQMKSYCRLIDIVTVKGSNHPVRLFTIDVNTDLPTSKNIKPVLNMKQKREKYKDKREKLLKKIKKEGSLSSYVLNKPRFQDLLATDIPEAFYKSFDAGFDSYIEGKWNLARTFFEEALIINPKDGPANTLLKYIKRRGYEAPREWRGYRELTSK